jgi:hypothetical protein
VIALLLLLLLAPFGGSAPAAEQLIRPCLYEDQLEPSCRWNAAADGLANGGTSFTVLWFPVADHALIVWDDGSAQWVPGSDGSHIDY